MVIVFTEPVLRPLTFLPCEVLDFCLLFNSPAAMYRNCGEFTWSNSEAEVFLVEGVRRLSGVRVWSNSKLAITNTLNFAKQPAANRRIANEKLDEAVMG